MRGRCPREGNFGDFTLKMAILSSFQAQGNRAAGMDIEIFGFPDSSDGLVCELFPAPTFWLSRERLSGKSLVLTRKVLERATWGEA